MGPMKVRPLPLVLLGASLLVRVSFASMGAEAQGTAHVQEARRVGEYAGVRPGTANPPPRQRALQRARSRGTVVTWPGFEERGGGRFFLQTTGTISTEVQTSPGKVEVILRGARTHVRNTRRWLHTRFFNTPVRRARIERRGRRDLAFVFEMRQDVRPNVTTGPGEGGYQYLFVDFPAGDYLPPELAELRRAREQRQAERQQQSQQADPSPYRDTERPPGM